MTQEGVGKSINTAAVIAAGLLALALVGQPVLEGFVQAVVKDIFGPAIEVPRPEPGPRTIDVRLESAAVLQVADLAGPGGYPLATAPRGGWPPPSTVPAAPPAPRVKNPAPIMPPSAPLVAVPRAVGPDPPAVTGPPAVVMPPVLTAPPVIATAPQASPPYKKVTETLAAAWQSFRGRLPPPAILMALLCVAVAVAFAWGGIEFFAILAFNIREWISGARQSLQTRRDENRRDRERRTYSGVTEDGFQAGIERRNKRIAEWARIQQILYSQADWLEVVLNVPFVVRRLRRSAAWYLEAAECEQEELDRLKKLWADLEQNRRAAKDAETGERVRMLLRLLGSKVEAAAANALAELNRIGKSFDWANLVPDLPGEVREKMVKLLRLMAGASTVSEAQAAYGRVLHLLKNHNATWRDMAA